MTDRPALGHSDPSRPRRCGRPWRAAEVGDDVYAEDPTVAALQERVAALFGHEAALFTPTGSMANLLAVRSLVGVGQEVLCESSAHVARAELGAHAAYTGLTMRTWTHPRGQVDLPAIQRMFAPDMGPFFVATAAVSVENTHNFAGGAVLPLEDLLGASRRGPTRSASRSTSTGPGSGTPTSPTGVPLAEYGAIADVLSVCLSKGLGAPVGSLLVGSAEAVAEARVWRKRMGGGMRQVGILAAAGLRRPRPPRRAARRGPRARPAAGRGVRCGPGHGGHQHRGHGAAGRRGVRGRSCRRGRPGLGGRAHHGAAGHPPRRRRRADARRAATVLARLSGPAARTPISLRWR